MARVTVIPSTLNPLTQAPINATIKRKVCAYARVSTDSDEQYTSYEAQVTYYKKYIQEVGFKEKKRVFFCKVIVGYKSEN